MTEQEKSILGDYTNTYTFSKAFAERALKKNRGNLPVTILRPSIIVACLDDPFQGWIDSPAASGGITLAVQLGIMRLVHSAPEAVMDLIPCDFVTSNILVQTAVTARQPEPQLNVVHSATTSKNPITFWQLRQLYMAYARYNPYYGHVNKPWAYPVASPKLFRLGINLSETIPTNMMEMYANATGDHKMKK